MKIIQNINLEESDKEIIRQILFPYKDSNEIFMEARIKNKRISTCYYCGELTGKK